MVSLVAGSCVVCGLLAFVFVMISCRKNRRSKFPRRRVLAVVPHIPPKPDVSDMLNISFPVRRYVTIDNPVCAACIVCQETFVKASEVRTLTCGHTYHSKCLELLFEQNFRCGVCNREFPILDTTSRSLCVNTTELRENLARDESAIDRHILKGNV